MRAGGPGRLGRLLVAGASVAAAGPAMVGRDELVSDLPPWLGVLCWCWGRRHGRACCVGAGPAAMVGLALPVPGSPAWLAVL